VDLRDPRYRDAEGLYLTAAEWQEFTEAKKAGKYAELTEPTEPGLPRVAHGRPLSRSYFRR
jgi:hypothetical protein